MREESARRLDVFRVPETEDCAGRRKKQTERGDRRKMTPRSGPLSLREAPRPGSGARTQTWRELCLVLRVRRNEAAHDTEEALRVVVDFDVDVEEDVLITREHEKVERLLKRRDLLMRRLARPQLVDLAVILLIVDRARAVGGTVCSAACAFLASTRVSRRNRVFRKVATATRRAARKGKTYPTKGRGT